MNIIIPMMMWFVDNYHEINRLWQIFKEVSNEV